ncbi:MAG: RHS repeat-associated core domain-containing protein, partial [Hydrococcus sp. C42_A2020_068]|nr:RHS repeat-associated core domain-containing protein [Hydrococcus sp. C42_A2020_068]
YDASNKLVAEYSTIVEPTATAKISYLTNDHLGSLRINTDANGNVITRHDYYPFGEELYTVQMTQGLGYTADSVRQQFTGYERDVEAGQDFAQARMYSYLHGRFTTVDPLRESAKAEDPQSWNRYIYSFNNPLRFTDPTGMIAGGFYDREGNWLGTDEVGDGKIYLLGPGQVPNKNKPNVNWGGKLDDQTVAELKAASIEVGGLIILDRIEEGKDYTIGKFKTVGGGDKDTSGYMLEPAGPDTTTPNQDKRVPEGLYNLDNHSGKRFKDTFVISNENVSKSRAILFHAGTNGSNTEGCIMPGSTKGTGTIGGSRNKMAELKAFIKAEGASNVKLIIRNRIRP